MLRDSKQSAKLWDSDFALYYLCITLEIKNISHSAITLGNIKINNVKIPNTQIINSSNVTNFNGDSSSSINVYYAVLDERSLTTVSIENIDVNKYKLIYPELRLDSKSQYTGIVLISLQQYGYDLLRDGKNKITIETPDKKFNSKIYSENKEYI